ncbi:hypothetical protein MUK42_37087 [Musa troglodytarum]|uniref:Uncharacterized protein n=1 Tax=Musa troglodytarum TaxID=320322 RepID=A0A9E7I1V5_9LILI|nr:hypothetical protein MUK42_37087 [Musa troglodytarum]
MNANWSFVGREDRLQRSAKLMATKDCLWFARIENSPYSSDRVNRCFLSLSTASLMSWVLCARSGTPANVVMLKFNRSRSRTCPSLRMSSFSTEAIWHKILVRRRLRASMRSLPRPLLPPQRYAPVLLLPPPKAPPPSSRPEKGFNGGG